jgi:hypothetical protein
MIDDRIPEESEEHNQQFIALLRCGLLEPPAITPREQSQIIDRVREQLMRGAALAIEVEEMPVQYHVRTRTWPAVSLPSLRDLAAVLLVGMLVGAALLIFRSAVHPGATHPSASSTGPAASVHVDGLQASIRVVTPGPYFLSELVSVDISLTNDTGRSFMIDGLDKPDYFCFSSALSAEITSGSAPTYTLPELPLNCLQPLFKSTLEPGGALTLHLLLPVTKTGDVTLTMGGMRSPREASPLDGHWPSVTIQVNPQVPSNRELSLRSQGTQVIVQAPPAAQAHLVYLQSITCDQYGGGSRLDWSPLPTPVLSQPACPTPHKHWEYIVSAPGFAIVSGIRDS